MSMLMPSVLYPVRTQPLYWVVVGALGTLGLASAGLIVYMLLGSYLSWTILGLGGLMAVLPIIYVMTTGEYRAQGAIRISRDLVEVPDARGHLLQFPVERLELQVTRVRVRVSMIAIPVASVSRGMVLELRAGDSLRRISTLTLADPEQGESLLADLERVRRGEDPRGPAAFMSPPSPPRPRDVLEAQLDRELAALD
jgi:hypothetical protein